MITLTREQTPSELVSMAHAINDIDNHMYVVIDSHTRALALPLAPMVGHVGIAADIARQYPGMTAVRLEDATLAARESLADTCYAMAGTESAANKLYLSQYWEYRRTGDVQAAETCLKRAERADEECDRLRFRASAILLAIGFQYGALYRDTSASN